MFDNLLNSIRNTLQGPLVKPASNLGPATPPPPAVATAFTSQDNKFHEKTPEELKPLIMKASQATGVPTALLSTLIFQESGFNPKATSPVGALGLMQFMPATAQGLKIDPLNPEQAVLAGAQYLKQQFDRFGSWDKALAAYNAGPGSVEKYGGVPPFPETQNYVKNILGKSNQITGGTPATKIEAPSVESLFPNQKAPPGGTPGSPGYVPKVIPLAPTPTIGVAPDIASALPPPPSWYPPTPSATRGPDFASILSNLIAPPIQARGYQPGRPLVNDQEMQSVLGQYAYSPNSIPASGPGPQYQNNTNYPQNASTNLGNGQAYIPGQGTINTSQAPNATSTKTKQPVYAAPPPNTSTANGPAYTPPPAYHVPNTSSPSGPVYTPPPYSSALSGGYSTDKTYNPYA